MADVKVTLNTKGIEDRFLKLHKKAQYAMSQQALKDCNYYCKQDQDGLISSSIMHSDLENGALIWKTPYAKKQYYLDSACKDKNPNAQKCGRTKPALNTKRTGWLYMTKYSKEGGKWKCRHKYCRQFQNF